MGDYDWGCIFAAAPLIGEDKIRMYYGANDGRFMAWRNGFFCLGWMRADGFAGYEQIAGGSNKTGSLTTKPVKVVGDSLCVSADVAPSGFVDVEALDNRGEVLAEGELVTTTSSRSGGSMPATRAVVVPASKSTLAPGSGRNSVAARAMASL